MTRSDGGRREAYGQDESQVGWLHLPTGERRPGVVVVVHGGFWRSQYGAELGEPLAEDLAARGWVAWNLEYRRVGDGGGWPATFEDVAAGIDHLAALRDDDGAALDLSQVAVVGHSAGGHLGAWAAGRPRLPAGSPGSDPTVRVTGVVSQAGVVELARAADEGVGGTAVPDLMGGSPADEPRRYAAGDPSALLPLGVPVRCVHARGDSNVPFDQSEGFVAAAREAGDDAALVEATGDHFTLIDVSSPDWGRCVDALEQVL
ncbi:alpha/beta hydrolase family protein [Solicola sp. PLA-1-18]|uniref:alpha/beta hydrolase family protein n=1 Tax=Solicola sp. PLA-1-18 TaxID=3380532 RepID=UPI003B7C279C